jgi:DNA primase RepB-like protein
MNPAEKPALTISSAPEYILDNFEHTDRIAVLVLNREFGETIQRITSAQKAASPEFQAWLRYKNANGSDIYIGMNPLKKDAATRTKEDIESIKHVYLDLDHRGSEALEAIENSSVVVSSVARRVTRSSHIPKQMRALGTSICTQTSLRS